MYFPIIFTFIRSRCIIESGRIWTGANAIKRWPSVLTPAFWCCLFATPTADSHAFAAAGHFFIFPRYFIQMLSIIHISRIFGNWYIWVTWLCVDIADLIFWNDFRYRKLFIVIIVLFPFFVISRCFAQNQEFLVRFAIFCWKFFC